MGDAGDASRFQVTAHRRKSREQAFDVTTRRLDPGNQQASTLLARLNAPRPPDP